ncbi:hypothetical protein BDW74DRAFT_83181 [Aspergillus multicolor]|uniref:DUF4246 domain-containing protein n=1 Tax=Aspergillus multicolor TaxID=41759 RepID=UPI003CCD3791
MMRIMNAITDKPDWDKKVFNGNITAKWREEIAQSDQDVSVKMMDWIIRELQWKAGILSDTGFVKVFDDGVVKSDTVIAEDLKAALKEAVRPFENVPQGQRDYHPASDRKVIDLVHPSLFPVVYGRTRVLPDRVIGLDDCLESIGEGTVLPTPSEKDTVQERTRAYYWRHQDLPAFSSKFQWLPCEVEMTDKGDCRILTYINNAHPLKHRSLYDVVEKILTQTMPLWESSLTEKPFRGDRIKFKEVEYEEDIEPEPKYPEDDAEEGGFDEYEEHRSAWYARRRIKQPEPQEFKVTKPIYDNLNFTKHFPDHKFQVIVKLANIELTPEKPDYEGGTWHIEGQLNERIVASAIYYYDCENITPSSLAFRQRANDDFLDINYEQDMHHFLQQIYGFPDDVDGWNDGLVTQDLGSVESKEGRLITFPNKLQHRVSPFSLADRSKSGHRKILALFLVDPHHRIISSANVPPQREDWREKQDQSQGDPQQVLSQGEGGAVPGYVMTMEEAKALRLELMQERGLKAEEHNQAYQIGSFSLCEH